ncbi:MAG: hypothetical protein A2033_00210 [Bacteroidetes bacterium GWA2_31_9]|nr:MAG: hypothetical protein A2033_00210 [Bacteroidetes bacterium GWA2_31_9]
MNKKLIGIFFGAIAGVIDVIPMIIQDLTWDANLSAFSMWVVVGFFISIVDLKIHPILKGIVVAYLSLIPVAILIAWKEPFTLIPIMIMCTLLGGLLGFSINCVNKKTPCFFKKLQE